MADGRLTVDILVAHLSEAQRKHGKFGPMRHVRTVFVTLALFALTGCVSAVATSDMTPHASDSEQASDLYVFTFRPGPAWQPGVPMRGQRLGSHAAYWRQLVADGRAFAAGGFSNSDGGMAVVIAASADEAEAIRTADPAIQSGVFIVTVERWIPSYRTDAPLPTAR